MPRRSSLAALTFVITLAASASAWADGTIEARTGNRYAPAEVTIGVGESLRLSNKDDASAHDITSTASDDVGEPLFRSGALQPGTVGLAEGASQLTPGTYPFYCAVHPDQMFGRLVVVPTSADDPDTEPPKVRARIAAVKLSTVVRRGSLMTTVSSNEAITAEVTARVGTVVIARRKLKLSDHPTQVLLGLRRSGLAALRGRSRVTVRLTVRAIDSDDHSATASATRTLRR